jgi:hypothetical protein
MAACERGHAEMACALLGAGAALAVRLSWGDAPLTLAVLLAAPAARTAVHVPDVRMRMLLMRAAMLASPELVGVDMHVYNMAWAWDMDMDMDMEMVDVPHGLGHGHVCMWHEKWSTLSMYTWCEAARPFASCVYMFSDGTAHNLTIFFKDIPFSTVHTRRSTPIIPHAPDPTLATLAPSGTARHTAALQPDPHAVGGRTHRTTGRPFFFQRYTIHGRVDGGGV